VDEPPSFEDEDDEPLITIDTVAPVAAKPAVAPAVKPAPAAKPAAKPAATPPPIPPAAKARAKPPPLPRVAPPPEKKQEARPTFRRTADPIVLGIDFGTTWSSVAVVLGDEVTVLQQGGGARQIPSVVGFLENGSVVIGREAQALLASEPQHAIASPKRLLGRRYRDPELEPYLASMAIPTSEARDGTVLIHGRGTPYSVPQICAPIIYYLRQVAQEYLGEELTRAVVTAPVSYEETRCSALREAAQLAGLETVEILDEPSAAAIAHNFDRDFKDLVAVYDFGGGTFDFSVVDTSKADLEVVATAGDIWLGGDDFDEAVANVAANAFWRENEIELRNQVIQWRQLLLASEKAKRQLSAKDEAVVALPQAALTQQGSIDLKHAISRAEFVDLASPIIQRSFDTCNDALSLSMIDVKELNAIYMSGGTTYIPAVREAVAAYFGKVGKVAVPPERAVVIGAAMYASRRYRERVQLLR
jgi:molecular chaperone DnaK